MIDSFNIVDTDKVYNTAVAISEVQDFKDPLQAYANDVSLDTIEAAGYDISELVEQYDSLSNEGKSIIKAHWHR